MMVDFSNSTEAVAQVKVFIDHLLRRNITGDLTFYVMKTLPFMNLESCLLPAGDTCQLAWLGSSVSSVFNCSTIGALCVS